MLSAYHCALLCAILYQVFSSAPIISPMIAILSLHGLLAGGGALWAVAHASPTHPGLWLMFLAFYLFQTPNTIVNSVHTKEAFEISL